MSQDIQGIKAFLKAIELTKKKLVSSKWGLDSTVSAMKIAAFNLQNTK
jgi:hypothetical protein